MFGDWIWLAEQEQENQRVLFWDGFMVEDLDAPCDVWICATDKYMLFINGVLQGMGPARSTRQEGWIDRYEITSQLRKGKNTIAVSVWNYGCSTYQSLYDHGKLIFDILQRGEVLVSSGESTWCMKDAGLIPGAPKRNVNLGPADYYDAQCGDGSWFLHPDEIKGWKKAVVCKRVNKRLRELPERKRTIGAKLPKRIVRIQDVKDDCQVFTVNLRHVLFADRRDADETNMNAFLGCVLRSERCQRGVISFPNRRWNGIFGSFRVGEKVYEASDACREIQVEMQEGENFFLMQIHGKYDDLYSHIEFRFSHPLTVCPVKESGFFVTLPTTVITTCQDGRHEIYEDIDFFTEEETRVFSCCSLEELQGRATKVKWISENDVKQDAYILSLMRLGKVVTEYAVKKNHLGVLWNGDDVTLLSPPEPGLEKRIIIDFGDLYVGYLSLILKASRGTILDIYGFENMYQGEVDYTIGLNNGARYICREGWQSYTSMAKMGMRYAMIRVVFGGEEPLLLQKFELLHETYRIANGGSFACNNELLNRIWKMCDQTMRDSVADVYADSPTYEQAFWLGDSLVSMNVDAYLFGDYEFIRHSIVTGISATENSPLGNALTPTDWTVTIPMWTMNWILMVMDYIAITGDRGIFSEVYPAIRERLYYFESLLTKEGGFLVKSWNLVDWAELDVSNDCICTAYQGILAYCFEKAAEEARVLGEEADGAFFENTSHKMRKFLSESLWDEKRRAYRDCLHADGAWSKTCSIQTHALLLYYNAISEPERKELAEIYVREGQEDFVQVGSPFQLYYQYEVLCRLGETDRVIKDIQKRWGEMLRFDSTTCWEVFPGFYENTRTRSYCHAWSASPALFMQKYLTGIQMEVEGFREITVNLQEPKLEWCRSSIPTPFGAIDLDWDQSDGHLLLRLPQEIRLRALRAEGFQVRIERTI